MNAQVRVVYDARERELQEAVEWLEWRKGCAEDELHAAIRELEEYRQAHRMPCDPQRPF